MSLAAVPPETIPEPEPIVATEVLLLLQEPPLVGSVAVIVLPAHTAAGPPIAAGTGLTVTGAVTTDPQPVLKVIVALPDDTPVTIPVSDPTEAIEVLLLLQAPGATSVMVITDPWHTDKGPPIAEAVIVFTVTIRVTLQPVPVL